MSPSVVIPTVTVLVSTSTTVRWTRSRSWLATSTSWRKRVEKGIPGKHNRNHHRDDGRDADPRRRRGQWKTLRLVALFGVPGVPRRRTRGVCLVGDPAGASDEEEDEDDDNVE